MKQSIYDRAAKNGCYLEATCTGISQWKWDELMKGARTANKRKVIKVALMLGIAEPEELKSVHYNPYTQQVTRTHIIYVNSGIEYFIKVN